MMEPVTQYGRCSLEQQQLVAVPVTVSPPPPPSGPLIEHSELALDNTCSLSPLFAACERPSDALSTSVLAMLSPRTQLDDEWMAAKGDMLQDLFRVWDADSVDEAPSSSGTSTSTSTSTSNSPEPTSPKSLTVEASAKFAVTKARPPKTQASKRSPRKSGSTNGKSNPAIISSSRRQKHEIQVLRSKALNLSEMVRRLNTVARTRRGTSSVTRYPESVSLCKAVAEEQHARLEQAQRENQQLKLTILDCKETVKNLRRALVKRAKGHALIVKTLQLPPIHPTFDFGLSAEDRKFFQSMVTDINIMWGNMDVALELLQTKTLRAHSGSFRSWDVRRDSAMTLFAEVVDCEEMPFRKAHVENAMRVLHDRKKAGSQIYDAHVFGGSPEVALTKSYFRYSSALESGMYRGRGASHGFKDNDDYRSYFVDIAYIEPIDASGNIAPGFLLKLQMWRVLTKQLHSVEDKQYPATLIQSYSTLMPVQIREPNPVRWEKELIENFVIPAWGRTITESYRALESTLFDLQ